MRMSEGSELRTFSCGLVELSYGTLNGSGSHTQALAYQIY